MGLAKCTGCGKNISEDDLASCEGQYLEDPPKGVECREGDWYCPQCLEACVPEGYPDGEYCKACRRAFELMNGVPDKPVRAGGSKQEMADLVFRARTQLGVSQGKFGHILGKPLRAVWEWEKGRSRVDDLHLLNFIKLVANCDNLPEKEELDEALALAETGRFYALHLIMNSIYGR